MECRGFHARAGALLCFLLSLSAGADAAGTLVAYYKFDACDWDTTLTAPDSVGSYDGSVSGAVARDTSATSGSKPDTCSSAAFSGGAVDINGLPVSTAGGAKTSVSFWMYWDGTNNVMPMGWNSHDLWLVSGSFGFNTGNSDVYGISSAGLANGWHHVVAVFTNRNVTANKLYIDGVQQTLTQRRSSPNNSRAVVDPHLRISGWWRTDGYRFSGRLDEFKVYTDEVDAAQVASDVAYAAPSCPVCLPPPPPPPGTLIAHYGFDDNWDVTGTLQDLVGSADGAFAPGGSVTRVSAPAQGGKPDTCYAGNFSGGAFDINGLAVSAAADAKTSVSFWMYWDGTNSVMPMGWRYHDLWFYGGSFGFNSASGDIYGIASAGLANSWRHVVAVFTNNNMYGNKLYIDGVEQTLTQRRGSPNNSRAVVDPHLRIGGWWANNSYRFRGRIDELKVYDGQADQSQVLTDMNAARPCTLASPVAYYALDEAIWSGAPGEVGDGSGNGHHGVAVNGAQTVANGRVCRAGETVNDGDAIGTTVDVDGNVGGRGTASFWFRPNWTNSGGERDTSRVLFDASLGTKYFKLVKSGRGGGIPGNWERRLAFIFEDGADTDFYAQTNANIFTNGTWVHLAVTWDFLADRFQIYVDGVRRANRNLNTNGTIPVLDTLYLGDNRSSYNPYGITGPADGTFDEVRIYDVVRTEAEIVADRDATHACGGADHYAVAHDGSGINCQAEAVTVTAHDASHNPVAGHTATLILSTGTGNGDWSLTAGAGTFTPGAADSGGAGYVFDAADNGVVVLALADTHAETVSINVSDGAVTEISGAATAAEDADLVFAPAGFNFLAGGVNNAVGTQIAGKASSLAPGAQVLELQAINTNDDTGACEAALVGANTIQLAFECLDPAACTASQVSISGTGIAGNNAGTSPLSYTGVSLDFGDATDTSAAFTLSYPDAGQLRLHAKYVLSPSNEELLGASNAFVARPFGFDIDFSDDRATNGSAGISYAADATGSVFTSAGGAFNATVTAVVWQAGDDGDGDGVPDASADLTDNNATPNFGQEAAGAAVDLSRTLVAPDPLTSNAGSLILSGGGGPTNLGGFAAGAKTVALEWDEVGIINIGAALSGGDYLGSGQTVTGTVLNVGRFNPARYGVTVAAVTPACTAVVGSEFTYARQAFTGTLTLEAQNAAGVRTQNYKDDGTNDFATLDPDTELSFLNGATAAAYDDKLIQFTAGADFSQGTTGQAGLDLQFRWDMGQQAPTTSSVQLSSPSSDDGNIPVAGVGGVNLNDLGSTEVRFGRLEVQSAFGSELLALAVPVQARYYDGAGFILNTADGCTAVGVASITLSNDVETGQTDGDIQVQAGIITQAAIANAPFSSGEAGLSFCPPGSPACTAGAGNTGYADVDFDLSGVSWLQYDWEDADGLGDGPYDDNPPRARAAFGLYKGQGQTIYMREPWQ